jgi:hypothetical protein
MYEWRHPAVDSIEFERIRASGGMDEGEEELFVVSTSERNHSTA